LIDKISAFTGCAIYQEIPPQTQSNKAMQKEKPQHDLRVEAFNGKR